MCLETEEKTVKTMKKLVYFWNDLYNAAPKLCIPFTQLDMAFSLISCVIICGLRLVFEYFYINILEFNPKTYKTIESAASLTSISHALVLVTGLWAVLTSQPYVPSATIKSAPKEYQNAVTALLQLCTGYMFYDAIFMYRSNGWTLHPDDVAFLGHHIVTVFYMNQCRVLGVGHVSAMGLMFTGEITNPMQNGHLVTKFGIQMAEDGSLFHLLHPYMEFSLSVTYFIFRAFIGPSQIVHNAYDFLLTKRGRENVSMKVSIFWVIISGGILVGSIPWTIESWEMIADGLEVKYDENWDYGPRYEI